MIPRDALSTRIGIDAGVMDYTADYTIEGPRTIALSRMDGQLAAQVNNTRLVYAKGMPLAIAPVCRS